MLVACGGIETIEVHPDGSVASDAGGLDVIDVIADAPEEEVGCSLEHVYEPGEFACCGGTLCRGNCVAGDRCECGGIDGGCHVGSVCCFGACLGSSEYLCRENLRGRDEPCDGSADARCCEGKPVAECNGYCASFRDGAPICDCLGVIGGCSQGQFCCPFMPWGCIPTQLCGK